MVTCLRCRELEAQIADLKRELGQEVKQAQMLDLRGLFGLQAQESLILSALYNARGRFLTIGHLEDICPSVAKNPRERRPDFIKVRICTLRRKIGSKAIETKYVSGYRLTELGRLIVEEAMERIAA